MECCAAQKRGGCWHCIALAPSYLSFMELVAGIVLDWSASGFPGTQQPLVRRPLADPGTPGTAGR